MNIFRFRHKPKYEWDFRRNCYMTRDTVAICEAIKGSPLTAEEQRQVRRKFGKEWPQL